MQDLLGGIVLEAEVHFPTAFRRPYPEPRVEVKIKHMRSLYMDKPFEERVREATLTATGRKIAEYCLTNRSSVAFQSLAAIAGQLGISDVSLVRFARSVGYSGFSDLKHALQNELIARIDEAPGNINTIVKYVANKELNRDEQNFRVENALDIYSTIMQETLQHNRTEDFELAAEKLIAAESKYVAGLRARTAPVHTMSLLLQTMLPHVHGVVDGEFQHFLRLQDMTGNDCVLLFSYGRYSDFEKQLLEKTRQTGACLIVISDQRMTPAAQAADLLLYAKANTSHLFYSNVGTIMVAEIIANTVATKNWEKSRKRLSVMDEYLNQKTIKY